jgi:hypothetical protein
LEGFMSRYINDRNGLRLLVAVHVPGGLRGPGWIPAQSSGS